MWTGQGCIQSASESGSRTGMCMGTGRTLEETLAHNKIEIDWKKEGWDPQVPGPTGKWPTDKVAWCMWMVQASCDTHIVWKAATSLGCGEVVSDWGLGRGLECNGVRSKGSSWCDRRLLHEAWGILNGVRRVNPVRHRGCKWMGLSLGNDHDTHTCQNEEAAWWPCVACCHWPLAEEDLIVLFVQFDTEYFDDCLFLLSFYVVLPYLCGRATQLDQPHKMIFVKISLWSPEDWIGHFFISPPLPPKATGCLKAMWWWFTLCHDQPIPVKCMSQFQFDSNSIPIWVLCSENYSHSVGYTVVLRPW